MASWCFGCIRNVLKLRAFGVSSSLRCRGLGFRSLGFRGLGFRGFGFRGLGFRSLVSGWLLVCCQGRAYRFSVRR